MKNQETPVLNTDDKTEQLVNYEEIKNTPFTLAKLKKKGKLNYVVLMGKYKVHDKIFTTKKEALQYVSDKNWDLLLQAIVILIKEQDRL